MFVCVSVGRSQVRLEHVKQKVLVLRKISHISAEVKLRFKYSEDPWGGNYIYITVTLIFVPLFVV